MAERTTEVDCNDSLVNIFVSFGIIQQQLILCSSENPAEDNNTYLPEMTKAARIKPGTKKKKEREERWQTQSAETTNSSEQQQRWSPKSDSKTSVYEALFITKYVHMTAHLTGEVHKSRVDFICVIDKSVGKVKEAAQSSEQLDQVT